VIGMVLAAGAGRRLRPDTDALPKALLPVHGPTTILDIVLRNMAEVGLSDVVIVVGHAAGEVSDRVRALERRSGLAIELVRNDRAEEWNNAYSLWLAREHFARGVLLSNGDTVHPASVEKTLLATVLAQGDDPLEPPPAAVAVLAQGDDPLEPPPAAVAVLAQGDDPPPQGRLIIAIDDVKQLGDEEMKVVLDAGGLVRRITKKMDPRQADGEYMGVTLIEPGAAAGLADALEATWRRDPGLYYEDGFAEFAGRGGEVLAAPIGVIEWVEVDNHADLRRARQIAGRC
jgi:choline kinase